MAFNDVINRLIPPGSVLAGNQPNVIDEQGGLHAAGTYPTDSVSNLVRSFTAYQEQVKAQQQEKMQKMKNQSDMYNTLRDSGYDAKSAYDAVIKGQFPKQAGGTTKDEAAVEKTQAETAKIKKETSLKTTSQKNLTEGIMNKIATGQELTAGEKMIYADFIKKRGGGDLTRKQAVDIISDPIKSQTVKDTDPALYDELVKTATGKDTLTAAVKLPPQQEALVQAWMKKYPNKTRDEIIAAAKQKGFLK